MSTGLPEMWLAPLMDQERLREGEKAGLDYEISEESQTAALLGAPRWMAPTGGSRPPEGFPWSRVPCWAGRAKWGWRELGGMAGHPCCRRGLRAQRSLTPSLLLFKREPTGPQKAAVRLGGPRGPRTGRDSQEHPLCHWGRAEDVPAKTRRPSIRGCRVHTDAQWV